MFYPTGLNGTNGYLTYTPSLFYYLLIHVNICFQDIRLIVKYSFLAQYALRT